MPPCGALGRGEPLPRLGWGVWPLHPSGQSSAALALRLKLARTRLGSNAGTIDVYVGPTASAGKEGQWIQTIPGKGWFTSMSRMR